MEQMQQAAMVTVLNGTAFMLDNSGDKVALMQGDMLPPGTVIMTEAGSSLVAIGDDFRLQLNESSLTGIPREQFELASVPPVLSNVGDDIAAMQAAILQGQDPTEAFEAAAAGLAQNVSSSIGSLDGSGNGGFVQILRTGDSRIAEAGFDTGVEGAEDNITSTREAQSRSASVAESSNNAPVASSTQLTVAEESTDIGLKLSVPTDADGDSLTITVTGLPSLGQVTLSDGTAVTLGQALTSAQLEGLQYDAPADYNVDDSVGEFSYAVDDGTTTTTGRVTLVVTPVNDAPVASSSQILVAEESTNTGLGLSVPSDADGDSLTIMVTGLPTLGQVTLADGTAVTNGQTLTSAQLEGLQYDAPADYNGTDPVGEFTYSVADDTTSTAGRVQIGVTAVNDAPVAKADMATTDEDTSMTIDALANDTDVDGPALSVKSATVSAEQGTVNIVDGKLVFTPAANFNGEATISYVATDGTLDTEVTTVTVTVTPVNDAAEVGGDTGGRGHEDSA
ncbi:retention module-containing protein, partial [Oceanisphaera sp. KMM 10153]|uniref:retention module-containing protein n=1 Tax=Oceanisphaera submarina TaxID=3390193 RepID=UPI0039769B50